MNTEQDCLAQFVALSVVLTGFERVELLGTGLAEQYYQTVTSIVGSAISEQLLAASAGIIERHRRDPAALDAAVRSEILASPGLGPVARNIIQLWYLGSWMQLPQGWRSEFGNDPGDVTHVVSAQAYQESLVYQVMRSHPPGAKQPGYGSWALSPEPDLEKSAAGRKPLEENP